MTVEMTTANREIVFEELARGLRTRASDDAQMGVRLLVVDWADARAFEEDMLGYSDSVGGLLSRVIPEQYPGRPHLWCSDLQLINEEGEHSQDSALQGLVQYDRAVYACSYHSLPWRVVDDDAIKGNELNRYVIRKRKFSFETQRVPGTDFRFDGVYGNQQIGEVPAAATAIIGLEYTWKGIPLSLVPEIVIPAYTINSTLFDDSTYPGETKLGGYPKGSVIFLGADERSYWTATGRYVSDLVYTFAVKSGTDSWQKILGPDRRLHPVVRVSDPTKSLFDYYDLNLLFAASELD